MFLCYVISNNNIRRNNMNDNNVNNDNVNLTPNSYTKDTDTRILDAKYAAMKKMAEAPTLSESYTINPDGSRTYFDKAAGARREFYVKHCHAFKIRCS